MIVVHYCSLYFRVCTRFRRITCDNSLWRHVDLLPYRLNVGKTWKVMRSHLSDCLLTFKIRGFLGKTGKYYIDQSTVIILNIGTDRSEQTVQTQIRLLLMEQSDQGLLCLLFCWHLLNTILHCNIQLFQL